MRSTTVTLAGVGYTVTQPPLRKNVAWQRKVAEQLKVLLTALPGLLTSLGPLLKTGDVKAGDLGGILGLLTSDNLPALTDAGGDVLIKITDAIPVMLDLLYEFSPALAAEKDHIEAEVGEDEVVLAFVELVKLSLPFGDRMATALKGLLETNNQTGSPSAPTSPSLPAPSGGSGTTS
jgi:hypothetical protein